MKHKTKGGGKKEYKILKDLKGEYFVWDETSLWELKTFLKYERLTGLLDKINLK
jgi:hypothetical protein